MRLQHFQKHQNLASACSYQMDGHTCLFQPSAGLATASVSPGPLSVGSPWRKNSPFAAGKSKGPRRLIYDSHFEQRAAKIKLKIEKSKNYKETEGSPGCSVKKKGR
jgi:hypothetical protein